MDRTPTTKTTTVERHPTGYRLQQGHFAIYSNKDRGFLVPFHASLNSKSHKRTALLLRRIRHTIRALQRQERQHLCRTAWHAVVVLRHSHITNMLPIIASAPNWKMYAHRTASYQLSNSITNRVSIYIVYVTPSWQLPNFASKYTSTLS